MWTPLRGEGCGRLARRRSRRKKRRRGGRGWWRPGGATGGSTVEVALLDACCWAACGLVWGVTYVSCKLRMMGADWMDGCRHRSGWTGPIDQIPDPGSPTPAFSVRGHWKQTMHGGSGGPALFGGNGRPNQRCRDPSFESSLSLDKRPLAVRRSSACVPCFSFLFPSVK